MAKIASYKYTIEEAFRECFYIVPDYQREYVWDDREVQQLLDDINEQIDSFSEREYFVGTVLVSPSESQKNHYDVIDGQQRLTTFFLILCALRELFRGEQQEETLNSLISTAYTDKNGNIRTSVKLEPRYENAGDLISKLVQLNAPPPAVRAGIKAAGIGTFGSLERLVNAYSTAHRYLCDNYNDTDKLKRYWGYLANNVVFVQLSTDLSSALKIFETINERGIGLNPMDLLKNLLFMRVKLSQFTQLKDEWKKITRPLEKAREKPLRFLRYFLMASYVVKSKRGDAVVREDEIYDWLVDKRNAAQCNYINEPFAFVAKIARSVDHYLAFSKGFGNDGNPNVEMETLRQLCGESFSLHYILLLAASPLPKSFFDYFVRQLESFLFYYIFTRTPTTELERSFSAWADELREISSIAETEGQKNALMAFVAERFQKGMNAKQRELNDALNRYSFYSMRQYRTQYLLSKLTQFVDAAYKGLKSAGSLKEYKGLDIEHILPDEPTPMLRAAFMAANPGSDYDEYKNRLGNLTLLEKPINIVASNNFFAVKKEEYRKSKYYLTSSIAEITAVGKDTSITRINRKLESFTDWTAESIDRRQLLLLELAHDIWKTTEM